ncbi:hypothetical protein D3C76_1500730 [compost metagenome]
MVEFKKLAVFILDNLGSWSHRVPGRRLAIAVDEHDGTEWNRRFTGECRHFARRRHHGQRIFPNGILRLYDDQLHGNRRLFAYDLAVYSAHSCRPGFIGAIILPYFCRAGRKRNIRLGAWHLAVTDRLCRGLL